MHVPRIAVAAVAFTALLAAQGGGDAGKEPTTLAGLQAELDAGNARYGAAVKELLATEAYKKAQQDRDSAALTKLREQLPTVDRKGLGRRALALAGTQKGDEQLKSLTWAARNSFDAAVVNEVVDQVLATHTGSPQLVELFESYQMLGRLVEPQKATALVEKVEQDNKHALVRAWAMYAHGTMLQRQRDAGEETKAKARQMLADAEQLAAGTELADRIAAPRFEQERLQIGMAAPDIEGKDMDGTPFKLSDYRGKVVVLDFWGFW